MSKEYALYKGDKFIMLGTIPIIAKKMGVKERTIRFYKSPTYKKRKQNSKDYLELVEIEEDEK